MSEQSNILAHIENFVRSDPKALAILYRDQILNYEELHQKSNQFAHFLLSKGVRPQTPVALCLNRSIELVVAFLGILKSGAIYIPLDPEHPKERLLSFVDELDINFILTDSSFSSIFEDSAIFLDQAYEEISKAPDQNLKQIQYSQL